MIFCHSIRSDWNHGNAHFLRGIATELQARGHEVIFQEPHRGWSVRNLVTEHGDGPLHEFQEQFPDIDARFYEPGAMDLEAILEGADVVLVHEWTAPELVKRIGKHRQVGGSYHLLFHDSHHRSATKPKEMAKYDLSGYDGVLAFGNVVRDIYLKRGWTKRAWTWHEAADTRVFHPVQGEPHEGDLVWVGNWGDGERTKELMEYLVLPSRAANLRTHIHGVRYPPAAKAALKLAGVDYRGWAPNFRVPEIFARHSMTVHVPRRPYVKSLPGVPTIRMFEALACGIPLVSAPWDDAEELFEAGEDYLVARNGREMTNHLRELRDDPSLRRRIGTRGRRTILERHTCGHRAEELLRIVEELGTAPASSAPTPTPTPTTAPASGPVAPRERTAAANARATAAAAPDSRKHIAFFASSLVSSYWNGAATYYRGILGALAGRGFRITFYEPDARDRQKHRDIEDPEWAKVVVYKPDEETVLQMLEQARGADVIVKASGVGVNDELLEREVLKLKDDETLVCFWDVDAPATLERMDQDEKDAFRACVPEYDVVFTYGGGQPVIDAYTRFGARRVVPIYNALDPETHRPAPADTRFASDLALLANRLPDREERIDEFFFRAAKALPDKSFLLGGAGWEDKSMPENVRFIGHVPTRDHNAFNCTPLAVLNVARASMARYGFSPATRVFEAAGAGACIITDAWKGIDHFLEPDTEILVANDGDEVARILSELTPERARDIGRRARERMLREHTYAHRAGELVRVLKEEGL